jgi:hypothetical protein
MTFTSIFSRVSFIWEKSQGDKTKSFATRIRIIQAGIGIDRAEEEMVSPAGIEPATCPLGGGRAIRCATGT